MTTKNISNREHMTVAAAEFWREFNETAQASMLTESLDLLSDADYYTFRQSRCVPLPLHRTEAGFPNCSTCDGGGCPDCTDPS